MRNVFTKFILVLGLALFGFMVFPVGALAQSAAQQAACEGAGIAGANCAADAGVSVNSVIALVINVLSVIVGIVAVIMIIIGGLKYITSSGDSNNINSAKNTILYAIIGLIIVALAQIIVRFVLQRVQGLPTGGGTTQGPSEGEPLAEQDEGSTPDATVPPTPAPRPDPSVVCTPPETPIVDANGDTICFRPFVRPR